MRISLLALDGVFDTGLSVMLDAFTMANNFSAQKKGALPFEITVVGLRKTVKSAQGFSVPVTLVAAAPKPDWIIVAALATGSPERLLPALLRPDIKMAKAYLQKSHANGIKVGASCIGSFILAEAGLLDNQDATTTWWLAPLFRQRYPKVRLDETKMLVQSGKVVTAGAALGHLDLALWFIRKRSPELADVVSRYMLADVRSLQAAYIIPNHLAQADELMVRFEKWSKTNLKKGFSLHGAAKALGVSTRSLQRRCSNVLGRSPLAYFQDLRVERARSLLQGGLDIEAIASEVGYEDGATLRTLLRERLGRGVRDLRSSSS